MNKLKIINFISILTMTTYLSVSTVYIYLCILVLLHHQQWQWNYIEIYPLCSLKSWKTLNFDRMNIITIVVNFIISLNLSAVINIMQPQFLFLLITYLWRKKKKMPCGLILYIIKLFDHLLGQIWFCLIEQFAGAFLIRSPFNVSHV